MRELPQAADGAAGGARSVVGRLAYQAENGARYARQAVDVDLTATIDLSADERAELRELDIRVHGPHESRPATPASQLTWAGLDDTLCAVRVRHDGLLVSSLYVNERRILVNGQQQHAGGIRGVLTDPGYRRRGFARAALQRGMTFMLDELQVELGLLLSSQMAVPLYQGLGWQIFDGPVLCEQPDGPINYTELMPGHPPMVLLPAGGTASGAIDMCGLPW